MNKHASTNPLKCQKAVFLYMLVYMYFRFNSWCSKLRQSNSVRVLQVHKLNKHREHDQIQVLGSAYDAPRRKTSNVQWGNQEQWTTKWNSCVVRIYLLFLIKHSKTGCLTDHIAK